MQSHYKILPAGDVRKNEELILDILTGVMQSRLANDIKLLNYYREIPFNFGASIEQVERGMVVITSHQLQTRLMQEQKETLILSSHFTHDVIAKVIRAKSEEGIAFLTHFSYAQILSDRRAHVRVEVKENIEAIFRADNLRFKGRLKDISVGGLAMLAPENSGVGENIKGEVSFSLREHRLQIPAILLRAVDLPSGKMFHIHYEPDKKSEEAISHFIFQIQGEILRELKEKG